MVLQEDAILHSEDVRNNFCYDLGFICTVWLQGSGMFYFSVFFFFNAEFKKNGNNNNTSSIPVSIPSPVPTVLIKQSFSADCFLWPLGFSTFSCGGRSWE